MHTVHFRGGGLLPAGFPLWLDPPRQSMTVRNLGYSVCKNPFMAKVICVAVCYNIRRHLGVISYVNSPGDRTTRIKFRPNFLTSECYGVYTNVAHLDLSIIYSYILVLVSWFSRRPTHLLALDIKVFNVLMSAQPWRALEMFFAVSKALYGD